MKIHKFNPIRKKDTLLFKLLIAVAGLHAIILFIVGGIIISEIVLEPETTFEAPPPPEKVEPKKQFQHKAKQQQKSSKQLVKRIQIPPAKMNNVSTANIALPSSDTAGAGLGGGIAPKGLGDMNIAMTSVNLLGVKGNTEKIVIVIDASGYMMTDAKGALNTYNVIKADIKKLINTLPSTVLFNVIAFTAPLPNEKLGEYYSEWISKMKMNAFNTNGLVPASQANKAKLIEWLDPINRTLADVGKLKSNYKMKWKFLPQLGDSRRGYSSRVSRYYVPYQAAVEQGADTIYILTSTWPTASAVKKPLTPEQQKAYSERVAAAKAAYDAKKNASNENKKDAAEAKKDAFNKLSDAEKAAATAAAKAKAAAAKEAAAAAAAARKEKQNAINEANKKALARAKAEIAAENAKRAKTGKSLFVSTPEQYARSKGWINDSKVRSSGGTRPFIAPSPPQHSYSVKTITDYYLKLISTKSKDEKSKLPVVNMILFRGKKEDIKGPTKNAEAWTKAHAGIVKVLVGTDL